MMSKCFYLTLLCVIMGIHVQAQSFSRADYIKISNRIAGEMVKYYKPNPVMIKKLCRQGMLLIKFRVNNKGKITELTFTNDSASFIQPELTKAVYSLQNDKELMALLTRFKRPVVQPFIYDYAEGCNFPDTQSWANSEVDYLKRKLKYYEAESNLSLSPISLVRILKFKDTELAYIDGLLLRPVLISAGSMY